MCSKMTAGSSTRTPTSTWLFSSSSPSPLHWLANHSAPERPGPAMRQGAVNRSPPPVTRVYAPSPAWISVTAVSNRKVCLSRMAS